jgi:hypothetical protein
MQAVKFLGAKRKIRKVVVLEHYSPPIEFQVHNSCVENLERSVLERVFWVNDGNGWVTPPQPDDNHFRSTLASFTNKLLPYLPKTTPVARNSFPELYTGRKREIYAQAAESLFNRNFGPGDAKVKAFVKAEKINFTSKPDPAPRLIQPRDPRYGVELGRYIKPLEKRIVKSINKLFNSPTIMKGLNAEESGRALYKKWGRFNTPVAVGLDAKRFDQHVHCSALEFEHNIYKHCFPLQKHRKELSRLLKYQLITKGTGYCTNGKVKYKKTGGRCSGDMNTGLGNCIIMCGLVYAYCEHANIDAYELANNGDDCVVIMDQKDLSKFSHGLYDWFFNMGFRMTVEAPVYEFERVDFCQTRPIYDGYSYVMVRNVTTGIAKDCVSTVYNDTMNSLYAYYRILGQAGIHLTGGIPVWQSFYLSLTRTIPRTKSGGIPLQLETGMMNLALRMDRKVRPPSPEARFSFWKAFGITPDEQILLEEHYTQAKMDWIGLKSTEHRDFNPWFFMGT